MEGYSNGWSDSIASHDETKSFTETTTTKFVNADAKNWWGESAASSETDKTSNAQSHSTTKSSTGHKTYTSTFNVDGTETAPVVDNTTTETTSTSSGSIVKSSTEWNGASNYAGELGDFYLGAYAAHSSRSFL